MILEAVGVGLAAYGAVGVAMCYRGPLARKRGWEAFRIITMITAAGRQVPPMKLGAYRALIFLGIVFLWPVFWFDDRRTPKNTRDE